MVGGRKELIPLADESGQLQDSQAELSVPDSGSVVGGRKERIPLKHESGSLQDSWAELSVPDSGSVIDTGRIVT